MNPYRSGDHDPVIPVNGPLRPLPRRNPFSKRAMNPYRNSDHGPAIPVKSPVRPLPPGPNPFFKHNVSVKSHKYASRDVGIEARDRADWKLRNPKRNTQFLLSGEEQGLLHEMLRREAWFDEDCFLEDF